MVERNRLAAAGPAVVTAADMVAGHVTLDISCLDRVLSQRLCRQAADSRRGGLFLPRSPGQADRVPGAVRADRGEVPEGHQGLGAGQRHPEAGHRFIALVSSLPGQVIVSDHPWYDAMAGKPPWAQSEAVHDVLRSGSAAARHDLEASIEATLTSPAVTTVFADNRGDTLGPGFERYFQLGSPVFTCTRCFFPVTDVPRRPYLRYDRR